MTTTFPVTTPMRSLLLPLLLASTALVMPVTAQETTDDETALLDAIRVVTTRHRIEDEQDVPEALTTFSDTDLTRLNVESLRDISDLTPNFGMLSNYRPGLERFEMRGLITPQVGDPPVVFVMDGVSAPHPEFVSPAFIDLERVEVLRGAQGATYGRGSVGGVVNIITRKPGDALEGSIDVAFANEDTRRFSGSVSGPIGDSGASFRLGAFSHESDGLIENVYLGRGADFQDERGVFGSLIVDASPDTEITFSANHHQSDDGIGYYNAVSPTQSSLEDFSIPVSQNIEGENNRESTQLGAKITHDFTGAQLTLATTWSRAVDKGIADGDLTALPSDPANGFFASWQYAYDYLKAWTGEARLVSQTDGPVSWAVGAFLQDREGFNTFTVYDDPDGTAPSPRADLDPALVQFAIQDETGSRSWGISGEVGYTPIETVELTLAGRYDTDRRTSVDPRDVANTDAAATFDAFQPKFTASWAPMPEMMVYGSYSRAFRSGGFNQYSPLVSRTYGAETTDSYALGVKSETFNGRLIANAALFLNQQEGAQLTTFNSSSFTLENIAIDEVRSDGFELDLRAIPLDRLNLRLTYGNTNSEIEAFSALPGLVGKRMPYVPEYSVTASADYTQPIATDLDLTGTLSLRQVGSRSYTLDFPDLMSETHEFVDLQLALNAGRWSASLYGRNIFDERQPEDLFAVYNGAVELARQPNAPGEYGVELSYRFGGQ